MSSPQFREVLSVLFVNSVQAFCRNISITVENLDTVVESPLNNLIYDPLRILVEDDGQGLPTRDFEVLFSPTYSTKNDKFGTGLGLFIGRGLARRAGGDLVVHQHQPVRGACFELILPTYER